MEMAASLADDSDEFKFSIPMLHYPNCDFSVAGMKNAALRHIVRLEKIYNVTGDELVPGVYNLAAGFQAAMTRHLCHRTQRAMEFAERKNLIPNDSNKTLVCRFHCSKLIEFVDRSTKQLIEFVDRSTKKLIQIVD